MKTGILAALAATVLVMGNFPGPARAGADKPPVLKLAKLFEPVASPSRKTRQAPVSAAKPAPARPATPVVASKSEPEPGDLAATGPDPVRRSLALKADLASGNPYIHTDAWLVAQAATSGGPEWQCLTEALYFEARGEVAEGVFAVAEVILNRVDSSRYPDTVCDVVNQGTGRKYACQFTYTCDGLPEHVKEPKAWARVGKVARAMLNGAPRVLTDGALFYHAAHVSPSWSLTKAMTSSIGDHRFYR